MESGDIISGSELDMSVLALCAVRLDTNTSAERFIQLIDDVVKAAKEEQILDQTFGDR